MKKILENSQDEEGLMINQSADFQIEKDKFISKLNEILKCPQLREELELFFEKNQGALPSNEEIAKSIMHVIDEQKDSIQGYKMSDFFFFLKDSLGDYFIHGTALGVAIGMEIGIQIGKSKFIDNYFSIRGVGKNIVEIKEKGTKKIKEKFSGKRDNSPKVIPTEKYLLIVIIHAKDLDINPSLHAGESVYQASIKMIVPKSRYMRVFSIQQGQEVFSRLKLSDDYIDYTQSIDVALLIQVSGTKDLLTANSPFAFKNELNPDSQAMAIVKEIKLLSSIEGVSDQLHDLT